MLLEVKTELSLVDPHSKYPGAQFDVGAIFHCEGLLLCTSVDESRFVVWNPLTGETRWFQPSYRGVKCRGFALGYDKNKSYKILSYYPEKDFEIYEFSSDSWRVVDDIMPVGWTLAYSNTSVSLKGSTYWFGFGIDETKTVSVSLVKFDFSTEKCVLVPLPYQGEESVFAAACVSVVKDEKLSVMLQREVTSKTEIWVSNKFDETTQVVSWNKVLSLDLSPDLQVTEEATFLFDEEKKFVVISTNWMDFEDEAGAGTRSKEMIYIVGEDNEVTQVDFGIEETPECHVGILDYVPRLLQIGQAGGKRKRHDM